MCWGWYGHHTFITTCTDRHSSATYTSLDHLCAWITFVSAFQRPYTKFVQHSALQHLTNVLQLELEACPTSVTSCSWWWRPAPTSARTARCAAYSASAGAAAPGQLCSVLLAATRSGVARRLRLTSKLPCPAASAHGCRATAFPALWRGCQRTVG